MERTITINLTLDDELGTVEDLAITEGLYNRMELLPLSNKPFTVREAAREIGAVLQEYL